MHVKHELGVSRVSLMHRIADGSPIVFAFLDLIDAGGVLLLHIAHALIALSAQ